jgi:hypothetical protein
MAADPEELFQVDELQQTFGHNEAAEVWSATSC